MPDSCSRHQNKLHPDDSMNTSQLSKLSSDLCTASILPRFMAPLTRSTFKNASASSSLAGNLLGTSRRRKLLPIISVLRAHNTQPTCTETHAGRILKHAILTFLVGIPCTLKRWNSISASRPGSTGNCPNLLHVNAKNRPVSLIWHS